jgi:amino acid transporter
MTPPPTPDRPSFSVRARRLLVGKPRDLQDRSIFHRLSLIAFLAWVGLGADGLSSSAYGPEEAFKQLGAHTYLAVALGLLMAITVLVISSAYRRIIEEFPSGGGGYAVATKLLGERAGSSRAGSPGGLCADHHDLIAAAGTQLPPAGWQRKCR